MAHVVKYHPSLSLLEQYTEGTLAPEVALIVAAHLDFCPHCQSLHRDIEADMGCSLAQSVTTDANDNFDAMLASILESVGSPTHVTDAESAVNANAKSTQILVGGHSFKLPRSLQRVASKPGKWLSIGGISTAKLPASDENHLSLLCIESGTAVPLHSHKGLEITLVLAGEIADEMGRYAAGDLIINTPDHTHTPRNQGSEACLCLSVLTAPLEFKQGMTRLLNPLQRFFY